MYKLREVGFAVLAGVRTGDEEHPVVQLNNKVIVLVMTSEVKM